MLIKFETKSNRVKGLSFHPHRPWILASLHNGTIQLWDYRMGTLMEKFDEHDGPVRGVDFHSTQPLFASGGDDYKIKVWNYKQKRCLFTLLGHLDYIRTVEFHREHPWLVSASDDQTIRIWNWQSRSLMSVLTGHNHYVMSACFHPSEDMVLSASLDQTVRVWDTEPLRKKSSAPGSGGGSDMGTPQAKLLEGASFLAGTDASVKHVLEGHDRGVNWASFHKTFPLIVSGADDRQVKLWRMSDTKAWEVDTLRGHVNNVSSVMFHPKQELIVSNSEDKAIRVWDIAKRTCVHTYRRENDRFWIQAAHPTQNLLAAGHDGGLMVYKLERERPAFTDNGSTLLYVKGKNVRAFEYSSQQDAPIMTIAPGTTKPPRSMTYNQAEKSVLLFYGEEGGCYELYRLPSPSQFEAPQTPLKGFGLAAVFVARNRFAVLERSRQIAIRNLENQDTKRVTPPLPSTNMMFPAASGQVLLRSDERIGLYSLEQRKMLAEVACSGVKYVVWSPDGSKVALLSKHAITLCSRTLEHLCMVHETIRLKSGHWDESGAFVYTTLNHVKYCLPNGDSGTIRTLDECVYVTKVSGDIVHCLDREGNNKTLFVDSTEYMFKAALWKKDFAAVKRFVQSSRITGNAVIGYLQKKGYPEVALHFAKDERLRFDLALQCGKIDVAWECAGAADDAECWERLGSEALKQGRLEVVEAAYQRTEAFERLSFLYLMTGQTDKLRAMLEISKQRGDVMGTFHNALYLGDVEERVRLLRESGQIALAYLTAVAHGLNEEGEALASQLGTDQELVMPQCAAQTLLSPPVPLASMTEWPLLNVAPDVFDGLPEGDPASDAVGVSNAAAAAIGDVGDDMWGDDDLAGLGLDPASGDGANGGAPDIGLGGGGEGGAAWDDDDIEIPDDIANLVAAGGGGGGRGHQVCWATGTAWARGGLGGEVAIGAVNFSRMRDEFVSLWAAAHTSLPQSDGTPPIILGIQESFELDDGKKVMLPPPGLKVEALVDRLKLAYTAFNRNSLEESMGHFSNILALIPLLRPAKDAIAEVERIRDECREYVLGLRLELQRRAIVKTDPKRGAELAALFSNCHLQPAHSILAIKTAMGMTYKLKNFADAGAFAKKLLEKGPDQKIAQQARQVMAVSQQEPTSKNAIELNWDPRNPFVVCGKDLLPIYRGSEFTKCPYCGCFYQSQHKGTQCVICEVSTIGASAHGLFKAPEFGNGGF